MKTSPNYRTRASAIAITIAATASLLASCSGDNKQGYVVSVDPAGSGVPFPNGTAEASWSVVETTTEETLWSVWGAPHHVLAVGDATTILERDGDQWPQAGVSDIGDFCDVWRSSVSGSPLARGDESKNDFAVVVGLSGTILAHDGDTWSLMKSGTKKDLFDAWGFDTGVAYAVGRDGTILRFASSWSAMESGTSLSFFGVWGSHHKNMYAVGALGMIKFYNGEEWAFVDNPAAENLSAVWGSSKDDVWVVGDNGTVLHYDGDAWKTVPVETELNLYDVWGTSPTDVWVVGQAGTILHFDGAEWVAMESGTPNDLFGVWGHSTDDVFAVGRVGTILHYSVDQ